MSELSQCVTHLQAQTQDTEQQQQQGSVISTLSVNMSQSLVSFTDDSEYTDTAFRSEYIIILSEEWNFQTSLVALTWIHSLSTQNQYPLLKKLNTILNHWQLDILDVQSNIVSYVMWEKLWRTHIDEITFQAA